MAYLPRSSAPHPPIPPEPRHWSDTVVPGSPCPEADTPCGHGHNEGQCQTIGETTCSHAGHSQAGIEVPQHAAGRMAFKQRSRPAIGQHKRAERTEFPLLHLSAVHIRDPVCGRKQQSAGLLPGFVASWPRDADGRAVRGPRYGGIRTQPQMQPASIVGNNPQRQVKNDPLRG